MVCSVGHKDGKLFHRQNIAKHVGDDKLQKLINFRREFIQNTHFNLSVICHQPGHKKK